MDNFHDDGEISAKIENMESSNEIESIDETLPELEVKNEEEDLTQNTSSMSNKKPKKPKNMGFKCDQCNYQTFRKSNFKKHLREHPKKDNTGESVQDRPTRANNIVFYNVPERGDDPTEIELLLRILSSNPPAVIRSTRVGKKNSKSARALKVTFGSSEEVQSLIRCRQKLQGKNIYLSLDLTPKEQAEKLKI